MGQLLFAAWLKSLLGLGIMLAGGFMTYAFLVKKADREDMVAGERDASEREVMVE